MERLSSKEFEELVEKFREKLQKIQVFLCDVDGILTTGHLFWSEKDDGFNRLFYCQDGYGLRLLKSHNIKTGIITAGEKGNILKKRIASIKPDFVFTDALDKLSSYNKIKEETGLEDENFLYIGDDFVDLPVLKKVGFSATAPHSSFEIQNACHYVTRKEGGAGCVREVIDLLRKAQNLEPRIGL